MKCKRLTIANSAIAICNTLFLIMSGAAWAGQFQWYNDPNSTVDFTFFARSCAQIISEPCPDNTIRLTDIQAVNLTDQVLPDVGLSLHLRGQGFFNPDGSLSPFALTWRNDKDGGLPTTSITPEPVCL
jgi:hypothetical protein